MSAMAVALCTWQLHPYLPWADPSKVGNAQIRIGVFNVFHHNENYNAGVDVLLTSDCDVLAVLEVSSEWDLALTDGLVHAYPYSVRVPQSDCCYGMSVYSRLPIVTDTVMYLTRDPVIKAMVTLNEVDVDVWCVHTRPPIFPNDTEERNLLLGLVAKEVAASGRSALLMGDLNIVPWAKEFKQLKAVSGMDDARRGFLATYPLELGIPLIPIDHILHTDTFSTSFCRTVLIPGSDHKGLVAGLSYR